MSLEQLESQILQLPDNERHAFAQWFYQHEHQFFSPSELPELNPALRIELDRRYEDLKSNPGLATPITNEMFDRIRATLKNVPSAKASSV